MESSSARLEDEQKKKGEILKQIAVLQAQLAGFPASGNVNINPSLSPKRKQPDSSCLAPSTPSPKKRKLDPSSNPNRGRSFNSRGQTYRPPDTLKLPFSSVVARPPPGKPQVGVPPTKPAPSAVLTALAGLHKRPTDTMSSKHVVRSSEFSEKPTTVPIPGRTDQKSSGGSIDVGPRDETEYNAPKRDDRLALVEDLDIGPAEHAPPFDDPFFEQLEPNSGIRLKSRIIAHDEMQEYLRGRYYLSPSRLYSVVRLLPDKQGYDVPVAGDFVIIAVVAERGPIKFSRAPVGVGGEEDDNGEADGQSSAKTGPDSKQDPKRKGKQKNEPTAKSSGKKYVNIKLVDFGARSRSSSSATGGKAVIRGDALLTLLLFESDSFDLATRDDGGKPEKVYKGGSRGAFEAMSKLKEGDVIALLNPKILKPFQRSTESPHPINNILALTPESASSIVVIGRARDLGMCTAVKRDDKLCGAWCDKRVSDVCDWHIQHAVERRRAGRPEFSIGTSGMSSTSAPKRKVAYDPARQWGLKPEEAKNPGSGATYIVSGHVVSGSAPSHSMHVAETMGREGQAKAKRKLTGKDTDRALKKLLERDKEGMKAVVKAREVVIRQGQDERKGKQAKTRKTRGKSEGKTPALDPSDEDVAAAVDSSKNQKSSYSAEVIKQLGFDPAAKPGHRRDSLTVQKKLETLAAVQTSRKEIELGPKPGQRIRSGVFVPPQRSGPTENPLVGPTTAGIPGLKKSLDVMVSAGMIDLDDSDEEL